MGWGIAIAIAKGIYDVYDSYQAKKDAEKAAREQESDLSALDYELKNQIEADTRRQIQLAETQNWLQTQGMLNSLIGVEGEVDLNLAGFDLLGDAMTILTDEIDIKARDLEKGRRKVLLQYIKSGVDTSGSVLMVLDEMKEDNEVEIARERLNLDEMDLDREEKLLRAESLVAGGQLTAANISASKSLLDLEKQSLTSQGRAKILAVERETRSIVAESKLTEKAFERDFISTGVDTGADWFNKYSEYKSNSSSTSSLGGASSTTRSGG